MLSRNRTSHCALVVGSAFLLVALANHAYAMPSDVQMQTVGHGTRLTDAEGHTLYTYDLDLSTPGTSTCTEDCAALHPPLTVENPLQDFSEPWSVVVRGDGSSQWAYNGRPLYRYARDLDPGAVFGALDGWNVAFDPMTKPAEFGVRDTVLGQILTLRDGRTVYAEDVSTSDTVECDITCQQNWLPVTAPWTARDSHAFSVVKRNDGLNQWAHESRPLFTYAGDADPGDIAGNGKQGWNAVVLEPALPTPDWVRVVGSDGGDLYGGRNGMTLYRLMIDQNASRQAFIGGNHCDPECLDRYWTPVRSESQVARVGNWSVVSSEHGGWQWAYKGMPLYQLNLETRPGQLYYTTFRQFQWMKPIMYELPALQGVF